MKQELYISDNLCTSCESYHESTIRCKGESEETRFVFCTYLGQAILNEVVECSARDEYEKYLFEEKQKEKG